MTCVSCIIFGIDALENPRSNHVSISKTRRSRIRGRTNTATRGSTIFRKVKRISYHEEHVGIKRAPYELLEGVEEVFGKPKDVRDQLLNTLDRVTCSNRTSMINFDDKEVRSS